MYSICVIDDEALLTQQIARSLGGRGYQVRSAVTAAEGLALVQEEPPDLVLLDLRLPDRKGLDLLPEILAADASIQVVLMTAYGSVSDAVEAMRAGASDYLQKPLDLDELRLLVERVLSRRKRDRELEYHRARGVPSGVVGDCPALLEVFEQARRLAQADLEPAKRPAILLTGETGTGKGLVARAIHDELGGGPFIEANCTAMPESLIEAELFGHERGSFTDAKVARTGLFEAADGGTIFLDEIGHASPELQAKLLKVLEDKRVRRVGSSRDRAVSVHVIAATNRDLDAAVAEGAFRQDLLYRLRVLHFEVPPLRERGADIEKLANHFCHEFSQLYGRKIRLDPGAQRALARYPWPGNVRELRNIIERAILLSGDPEMSELSIQGLLQPRGERSEERGGFDLPEEGLSLAALERDLIRQALEKAQGNRTRASALLGLSRDTLRYRMEKFEIE